MPPHGLGVDAHADTHVQQHARVALVGSVRVAHDVRRPLVLGRVGVSRADVLVLQRFELLLGAEFVGLCAKGGVSGLCFSIGMNLEDMYHFCWVGNVMNQCAGWCSSFVGCM